MLVIKIELHPASGRPSHEIGRMVIANVGGTDELGDYAVKARGARPHLYPTPWEPVSTENVIDHPTMTGIVTGHKRLAEPVWSLVAKALYAIGFSHMGKRVCGAHYGDADDVCLRPFQHSGPCG